MSDSPRNFKLATYQTEAQARAGVLINGVVYDAEHLTQRPSYASMRGILDDWRSAYVSIEAALASPRIAGQPESSVRFLAALPDPGTIFCVGANYQEHIENMALKLGVPAGPGLKELGLPPFFFIKSSRCVVGPDAEVPWSTLQMDYEAELGIVIGARIRKVSVEEALAGVAGYLIANDMSARDRRSRDAVAIASPFRHDWMAHKNFDGACPLGAFMTPAANVRDPQSLDIKTWVNSDLRQDSNTSKMIFHLAEIISHLSYTVTLFPGDLILSGTPSGVAGETGQFLNIGDTVRIEIEELGSLESRIVEDA